MKGFRELYVALLLAALPLTDAASFSSNLQPEVQGEQRRTRRSRRSADGQVNAEPIVRQTANTPHMVPGVHPHLNKRDPAHLLSRRSATLFYTQNNNIYLQDAAMVATLDALFHWETVVLDHSDYVNNVTCQPGQMNIQLNSLQSFKSAKSNWTHDDTIVFVSSSTSCHTKFPGQFGYFNTTSISFDQPSLMATANGTQISVDQAVAEFNIVWGKWNSMGQPKASSSSASSSTASSSTFKVNNNAALPIIAASTSSSTQSTTASSSSTSKSSSTTTSSKTTTSTATSSSSSTTTSSKTSTSTATSSSSSTSKTSSTTSSSITKPSTSTASTSTSSSLTAKTSSTTSSTSSSSKITTQSSSMATSTKTSLTSSSSKTSTTYSTATSTKTSSSSSTSSGKGSTTSSTATQSTTGSKGSTSSSATTSSSKTTGSSSSSSSSTSSKPSSTTTSSVNKGMPVIAAAAATTSTSAQSTGQVTGTTMLASTTVANATSAGGFNLTAPTGTGICGALPKPIPTAFSPYFKKLACDNSFDKAVDDFLTYLSDVANLQQYLNTWAPNTGIKSSDVQAGGLRRRIATIVRRYSFGDFLSDCVHVIGEVVEAILEAARAALDAIEDLAESILPTWHPSISFDVPINLSPPDFELDDSPWGDGYQIYEWHPGKEGETNNGASLGALAKLTGADELLTFDIDGVTQLPIPGIKLWCVNCKVTGTMEVTGQATFTLPFGITDLVIKLDGDITANMGIGLDAFAEYTASLFDIRIFEIGVPGFEIPEIIAVGPYLTLDINANLKVESVGQFLAGAEFHWEKFGQTLDLILPIRSKGHGYAPQVKPKFKATGNVTATASLGIPLGLNVGIDILDGTFQEAIALVDRPAIEAVAEYDVTGHPVYADGMDPCEGILYYADLVNQVTLNIFNQFKYDLGSWHSDKFLKGCVGDNGIDTVQEALQALPAGTTQAGCTLVTEVFKNPSFESNNGDTHPWILDGGGASIGLTEDEDNTHDGTQSLQWKNEWVRDCGALCFSSCGFAGLCTHCCKPAAQDWHARVSQKISMCTYAQYDFQLWARVVSAEGVCTITNVFVNNLDDTNPALSQSWDLNHDILPITDHNKAQFPLVDNGFGFPISIASYTNQKSYNVEVGFNMICKNAVNFDVRIDDITLSPDSSSYANKLKRRNLEGNATMTIEERQNSLPAISSQNALPAVSTQNSLPAISSKAVIPVLATGTAAPALPAVNAAPAIGVTQDLPILAPANAAPTLAPANDAPAFAYVAHDNAVSGTYTVGAPVPTATAVLLGPADYNFPPFSKVMASASLGAVGAAAPTAGSGLPFTGWSSLTNINKANRLAAADDGNLYLTGNSNSPLPGTQFYSEKSIAFKDEQNRMPHYYPDTMAAYGVSRIRMSSVLNTPLTAQLITFVPVKTPSGPAYVAADTANHNYFLTECTAPHWQGSKVFLVNDLKTGPAKLLSGDVQWIVTGNNVTECNPLVLTSSAGGLTPV